MTDRESFIAAIAANPDNDTPRLAFADWLEEGGDGSRAGFIRDQVRLAKLRPGTEEYLELYRRTGATLRANLPAWIQDACEAFGQPANWEPMRSRRSGLTIGIGKSGPDTTLISTDGLLHGSFERGFLENVTVNVHTHRDGLPMDRLLRENPITRLTLLFNSPKFREQDAVAPLRHIRALSVLGYFTEESASAIFNSSVWQSLKFLSIVDRSSDAIQVLCRSPLSKRLQSLRIELHPANMDALSRFPLDYSLRELSVFPSALQINNDWVAPDSIAGLSTLPFRPTLKKLALSYCTIRDAGLAQLARGDVWIRLRSLSLDGNRFGDPGWRDFVRGRRTPELRMLTASRNFLTNDGAIRLGESSLVETLEYVDLRGNRIEGKGAMALARSFADSPLKKLLLAGNPIRESDAAAVRKVLGERVDIG